MDLITMLVIVSWFLIKKLIFTLRPYAWPQPLGADMKNLKLLKIKSSRIDTLNYALRTFLNFDLQDLKFDPNRPMRICIFRYLSACIYMYPFKRYCAWPVFNIFLMFCIFMHFGYRIFSIISTDWKWAWLENKHFPKL